MYLKFCSIYKFVFAISCFIAITFNCRANTNDSISTIFNNGEFITYSQVVVNAPKEVLTKVIEDFEYQTKYDLDALFKWGLKGMNLRMEKNELLVFNLKSTKFNKKTGLIRGTGEVVVPHIITFPNINIDSKIESTYYQDGKMKVQLDVYYSEAFLKMTKGVFYLIPKTGGSCMLTLETRVKFGWFFDIFMTQYTYKTIMEWRFRRLMLNMKDEAERRKKVL